MSEYKTTLKSMAYSYLELKKAAGLILQGLSQEELERQTIEENIFMVNTETRKKEIASTLRLRMQYLDPFLMERLVNGSTETSKQVALYVVLKGDRLFFEFMQEVYKEKYILKDYVITDKDFSIFFSRKAEQSETIAKWTDYTFYKMKQVYKRVLREAGFTKNIKEGIEIVPPIFEYDLVDHIKDKGDSIYLEAMLGEI